MITQMTLGRGLKIWVGVEIETLPGGDTVHTGVDSVILHSDTNGQQALDSGIGKQQDLED